MGETLCRKSWRRGSGGALKLAEQEAIGLLGDGRNAPRWSERGKPRPLRGAAAGPP